jgi:tRNA(Ile2)-agmatinylcytidine synthase
LEKLVLRRLAAASIAKKPTCTSCGRSMKSIGRDAGFRCRRCRTRAGPKDAVRVPLARQIVLGRYEVPKCARRHLSRPFER